MENKEFNDSMNTTIYVVFHKPYEIILSDILLPISSKECGLNILTSDTLDNRSHENYLLSEYSTFYWAWKNDLKSKYIGFFHYRRYLAFEKELTVNTKKLTDYKWDYKTLCENFNECDLILPNPLQLWETVYNQYCYFHDKKLLDEAINIIKRKYPIEYLECADEVLKRRWGYFCNIFICKREIFDGYMEFVFDIFDELKKIVTHENEDRCLGFVGERLMNIYIEYLKRYTNIKIKEVPMIYTD